MPYISQLVACYMLQSTRVCYMLQSRLTLCDPIDYSLPGSSVHGILQAQIQEWVVIPCSRRSSWSRDQTWVSCTEGRFFTTEPPGKPQFDNKPEIKRNIKFPGGSDSKESVCNAGDLGFNPWFGKMPWRREWQPTPIFLPGEFHGQGSLVDCSPWGRKESDMTEQLTL